MIAKVAAWFMGLSNIGKAGVIGTAVVASSVAASPPPPEPPAQQTPEQNTTQTVQDTVETKTVTETKEIQFKTVEKEDPSLPKGEKKVTQQGEHGVIIIAYEVTYRNGTEVSRTKISEETTTKPKDKIVAVGTYVEPETEPTQSNCDPNYTGCVPNVYPEDVDCAGGSGNGPYYAQGPVQVIGSDRYRLDGDKDGYACE